MGCHKFDFHFTLDPGLLDGCIGWVRIRGAKGNRRWPHRFGVALQNLF